MSPLQLKKRLRLLEARTLMHSHGGHADTAADAVGYASVPQLTREDGRLFGLSPVADSRVAVARVLASA